MFHTRCPASSLCCRSWSFAVRPSLSSLLITDFSYQNPSPSPPTTTTAPHPIRSAGRVDGAHLYRRQRSYLWPWHLHGLIPSSPEGNTRPEAQLAPKQRYICVHVPLCVRENVFFASPSPSPAKIMHRKSSWNPRWEFNCCLILGHERKKKRERNSGMLLRPRRRLPG